MQHDLIVDAHDVERRAEHAVRSHLGGPQIVYGQREEAQAQRQQHDGGRLQQQLSAAAREAADTHTELT